MGADACQTPSIINGVLWMEKGQMALPTFPVALPLQGRSVLVVGGGELALRKARLLAKSGCQLTVIDPEPLDELVNLAAATHRRLFRAEDALGRALIFAASGDDAQDEAIAAAARAAGALVNVPDRPAWSSFIMPAIIDRAPIAIAISSGGASPVLVRRLRERLEAALEPGLGRFAGLLDEFRAAVKATRSDETARRRFWEAVTDGPLARRFLRGDEAGARQGLLQVLNDPAYGQAAQGEVALVGAGPGDPDLLTLKALRCLQNADVVVYDKLVDDRILDYVRRDARRIFAGKSRATRAMSQEAIHALLIAEAKAGRRVVRLKGGDPFLFGRGGEEMQALRAAGVPVDIVPGVTAALGCGAAAGIPVTHRDHAQGVTFVTGHSRSGEPELDWQALARLRHTLVFYMGLAHLPIIERRLVEAGMAASMPTAIIENGARPDQRVLVGPLQGLALRAQEQVAQSPSLLIVGEVAQLADPDRIAALAAPYWRAAI
jgi:uroporphyrin-III C-methyltransferase / precorrin-2 dehydrogenase / sirohydrochlorin ferrochelatase